MERVWDMGKKLAFGGAVLVAVPVTLPVVLPCLFVLSFAAAVLSVPVASTAVGYYALKKVLGFGKTRVLGWHSDTDGDENRGTIDQHEARGPKVEEILPPSSAVSTSPGECEIVPVSQEPTTDHQHDEGYDDQDMVEGSPQVGLCTPPPSAPHPEDAEWEQIGAEGAPEVCEEKAAAEMVKMNVREQPQVNAFIGSQNGGEYPQDELVDKQEVDKAQKKQEETVNQEGQAEAEGDKPHQQAETLSADEHRGQENERDNHLVQMLEPEFDHIHDEDLERKLEGTGVSEQKPDEVHGELAGPHDAGKKRLASEVAYLPAQGEEKVPREENMHMHPEQVPEEGGERLLEQSESSLASQLKPEAEEKDLGVPREEYMPMHHEHLPEEGESESPTSEAEEREPGAEQLKPEAEKELGAEQLKPEAEEKLKPEIDEKEPGAKPEAEEKNLQLRPEVDEKEPGAEPGAEQLKPEAEEKNLQLRPEVDGKEPGAEQLKPEAEEEPLREPEAEQLKPLLTPEAEADDGDRLEDYDLVQGSEPEADNIHDDDLEPLLERTEQKPVDMELEAGADMQETQHGIYDGDSEQAVVVEPEEDHHHDSHEPVVVELEEPEPAGVESEAGGGNRSEHDTTGYHRLDGASSMDEYGSVAEEFPEEGVSSSDEFLSRTSSTRSEDWLLREILTVQKVVGYMDDLRESPADEVERLYDFLGVEMPAAYEKTTDPRKLLESLDLLKAIVGVK